APRDAFATDRVWFLSHVDRGLRQNEHDRSRKAGRQPRAPGHTAGAAGTGRAAPWRQDWVFRTRGGDDLLLGRLLRRLAPGIKPRCSPHSRCGYGNDVPDRLRRLAMEIRSCPTGHAARNGGSAAAVLYLGLLQYLL